MNCRKNSNFGDKMTIQDLLNECEKAYGEHDYSRLEWVCNQILDEYNDNETALTYKLYVYCYWHQYRFVFETANRIHELYPNNYHAYNAKAIAYLGKNEFENALECCEEGLKIKDYYWLKINKIESLISLNRIDDAYEIYKSFDIPDYNFTKALINCGKYSEISEYDEDLLKEELIGYFFKRCQYLDRIGNWKEILKVCDEIFKIDEDNEIALEYKIYSLAFLEKKEEVLKCCDYAMKLYPENFRFYFEKGETLLWTFEDIDGAIEYYEKGFNFVEDSGRHWPDIDNIVEALNRKADQFIESGNYKKAVNIYDKVLFYKPREFEALDNIDMLVKEHNIKYEPSKYYEKSLKLKMEHENRFNQIDEYLKGIDVGEYDLEYVNGCSEFKEYGSLAEYIHDIIICLMDAYPNYDEESSKYLVKIAFENVKKSYEFKEPAYDFAVVYGFSCG